MFTGLVEELGQVKTINLDSDGAWVVVSASLVTSDIANGDSIAVNGVCLTALDVTALGVSYFSSAGNTPPTQGYASDFRLVPVGYY